MFQNIADDQLCMCEYMCIYAFSMACKLFNEAKLKFIKKKHFSRNLSNKQEKEVLRKRTVHAQEQGQVSQESHGIACLKCGQSQMTHMSTNRFSVL